MASGDEVPELLESVLLPPLQSVIIFGGKGGPVCGVLVSLAREKTFDSLAPAQGEANPVDSESVGRSLAQTVTL